MWRMKKLMYFYILVNHRKVSFGRMIGCDNENCPTEWFHFPCVGLDDSLPVIDYILSLPFCYFSLVNLGLMFEQDPEEWYCANCRPILRTA